MLLTVFEFSLITILPFLSDKAKSLIKYNATISSFFEGGGQGRPGQATKQVEVFMMAEGFWKPADPGSNPGSTNDLYMILAS